MGILLARPLLSTLKTDQSPHAQEAGPLGDLSGHVIICGAEGSFVNFVEQLRRCDPMPTPVVVLHPRRPSAIWTALKALGPVHFVAGAAEAASAVLLLLDRLRRTEEGIARAVSSRSPTQGRSLGITKHQAIQNSSQHVIQLEGEGPLVYQCLT